MATISEGVLGFGLLRGLLVVVVDLVILGDMLTFIVQVYTFSFYFISSSLSSLVSSS